MSSEMITVVSALAGAIMGGIGTEILGHFYREKKERKEKHKELLKRHLYGFQDSVDSLWFRFNNLRYRGGADVMKDKDYLLSSTSYALGNVLAHYRIMRLEGIYVDFGFIGIDFKQFKQNTEKFDKLLDRIGYLIKNNFFQYDRISLAESLLSRDEGSNTYRIMTYLEFKEKWFTGENPKTRTLKSTINFVEALARESENLAVVDDMLENLYELSSQLSLETGMEPAKRTKYRRL